MTLSTHAIEPIGCECCPLSPLCLPRGLSPDEVSQVAASVRRKRVLRKGEALFRCGDPFGGIFAIRSGTAKTLSYDSDGNEYLTGILLPGDLLGFDGLAESGHHSTAVALEPASICHLPIPAFDRLGKDIPNMLRALLRHASIRMSDEAQQVQLLKRPAGQRVAALLINLSDRLNDRGLSGEEFRLSLSRQEMGSYLGLALETVSRTLGQLQDAGLITVDNRTVRILNRSELERLVA